MNGNLVVIALAGLNLAQGCLYCYRERLLIRKLADRVQIAKAPAPSSSSVPKTEPVTAQQPVADPDQRWSATGGPSHEAEAA